MTTVDDILTANLAQLRLTDPDLATHVLQASPAKLEWVASRAGPLAGAIEHDGGLLWLCSRYDPLAEAVKFADRADLSQTACVVVLGLAVGHHVAQLATRMGDTQTLMIVFEPDLAMFRAVLEKVNHTAWLGRHNVVVVAGQTDRASLLKRIESFAGMLTQGTVLLTHPATRRLRGKALKDFGQKVTEVLEYCRTNVATALVNAARTYRNLSMNLHRYAAGANVNELLGAAKGFPAVCVGAGPSLTRNIEQLTDAQTRRRVVVISAQTMLKPLLDRGITPDFVTALDYHEISTRFYDGLPDLPGITLVAQPLVHPAVLDRYPGPIRLTQSHFLDLMLGDQATPIVPMPYGATVSHLCFYLAQHLGCDPIILVGMDLGFSDGLYYFPGTAIHEVWGPELGPFNTLEMMEWQRIVRHRGHLKKVQDIHGQPIYSDEQMLTYLKQFERDFSHAPQAVIDATEGGLPKQHTHRQTLAQALAQHATRPVVPLPMPARSLDAQRLSDVARVLRQRRSEVSELRRLSGQTIPLLRKMIEHQRDRVRMDRLFTKLKPIQRRVEELSNAFDLVNNLNTIGTFRRARADRAIENVSVDAFERQRKRLERDVENVDWVGQACDEMSTIIGDALDCVEQSRQATNEPADPRAHGTGAALQRHA